MKILASLIVILPFTVFSQKFTVSVSPASGTEINGVLVGNYMYDISTSARSQFAFTASIYKVKYDATIFQSDNTGQRVKKHELANGERVYGPFPPFLKKINNKLYFFSYELNEEAETMKLKASEVDPNTLEPGPNAREIMTLGQKNLGAFNGITSWGGTEARLFYSADESQTLLVWNSGRGNIINYAVFDASFKNTRSGSFEITDAKQFITNNGFIDNQGNALIAYSFPGKHDRQYSHVLVDRNGKSKDVEVGLEDAMAFNAFVSVKPGGRAITVVGVYKLASDNLAGSYMATIDPSSLTVTSSTKTPFPAQLVEQLDADNVASTRPKKYGIYDAITFEQKQMENGDVDLVGDFWYQKANPTGDIMDRTSHVQQGSMVSGSILNIRFVGDKAVCWAVPKYREFDAGNAGDGFLAYPYKNKLIIFYNDNHDNFDQDITKAPKHKTLFKDFMLAAAVVAEDGSLKRQIVYETNDNFIALVENFEKLAPNVFRVAIRKFRAKNSVDNLKLGTLTIAD